MLNMWDLYLCQEKSLPYECGGDNSAGVEEAPAGALTGNTCHQGYNLRRKVPTKWE